MRPDTPPPGRAGHPGDPAAPGNHPAARPTNSPDGTDHIAEAERLERTAGRYPEDSERLLLQAAAHLELAGARERATTLYDRLLSPTAPAALEQPLLVKALKAANLWEYGHEAEARAIINGVRAAAPADPAPWVIIAEALEAHDELDTAHATFTQAATRLIGAEAPAHPLDEPKSPPATTDPQHATTQAPPPPDAQPDTQPSARPDTHPVLFGRHRVRRMLGADHDAWDRLADALNPSSVPLDELHDPNRVWALGSDNPAELRAEISRLRAELGAYRAALSRPFPVAVLHWPKTELDELLAAYPALSTEYPSHEDHLATIESSLRELSTSGTPNLGIVSATVPSYEAFAASESATPTDAALLPQYTTTLAARGLATPWPPAGGDVCWCGSGDTYAACHGADG